MVSTAHPAARHKIHHQRQARRAARRDIGGHHEAVGAHAVHKRTGQETHDISKFFLSCSASWAPPPFLKMPINSSQQTRPMTISPYSARVSKLFKSKQLITGITPAFQRIPALCFPLFYSLSAYPGMRPPWPWPRRPRSCGPPPSFPPPHSLWNGRTCPRARI